MDDGAIAAALESNSIPGFATRTDCRGVAVITGGSSGMGLAFAKRAATCGMSVVVLDVSTTTFLELEDSLKGLGAAGVMTRKCDVSNWHEMKEAAADALRRFPDLPISLICANAGYGGPALFDGEPSAIQKQLDVLASGVIWTFKAFQESFLGQEEPCALVATSSLAGVLPAPGSYGVGKHAAVAIMEALYGELKHTNRRRKHNISVHVLCPGVVSTGIGKHTVAGADHPTQHVDELAKIRDLPSKQQIEKLAKLAFRQLLEEQGMPADYAADVVWNAISTGKFYLNMDHPDENYSVHAERMIALRHARLEVGAPPPSREDLMGSGIPEEGSMMKSVSKRVMKMMKEIEEELVPAKAKL